ncbi:MAG: ATP-binding protein [Thermoplasmatota archaeon]
MYVERNINEGFKVLIENVKVIALVGPRQCGKTTFLKHLSKEYSANYVTFDDPDVRSIFNDIKAFEGQYIHEGSPTILDEVQYGSDPGIKIKYLADRENFLWITSSTETLLGTSVLSHLVGRVSVKKLYPFDLEEFLRAKGQISLTETILHRFVDEHMMFGGFPGIVLQEDKEVKVTLLRSLLETMILKDVARTFSISDLDSLWRLARLIAVNVGSSLTIDRICSDLDLSFQTVKKYIEALRASYLYFEVPPFFHNKNLEMKKQPRYYFMDMGLRNALVNEFPLKPDGKAFENYVMSEIVKWGFTPKYWRTKGGAEVDIVLEFGKEIIPIEIKTTLKGPRMSKGFMSFIEKYDPKRGYLVGYEVEERSTVKKGCTVKAVSIRNLKNELQEIQDHTIRSR